MGTGTIKERISIAGKVIKSCPFCGKDDGDDSRDIENDSIIRCMSCGAIGPGCEQLSDAIKAWNERKKDV